MSLRLISRLLRITNPAPWNSGVPDCPRRPGESCVNCAHAAARRLANGRISPVCGRDGWIREPGDWCGMWADGIAGPSTLARRVEETGHA